MVGIEIAERFIRHAEASELGDARGIEYRVASAVELQFTRALSQWFRLLLIRVRKVQATS